MRLPRGNSPFIGVALLIILSTFYPTVPTAGQQRDTADTKAPDLKAAKAGKGEPLSLTPLPSGVPTKEAATLPAGAGALLKNPGSSRVRLAQSGDSVYLLIMVEFDTSRSRERLRAPGITVLTAFDRFVELFVPADPGGNGPDPNVMRTLLYTPGLRWFEIATAITVPPPPAMQMGKPTRAVPEQIVHGGYEGLTGKGVIVTVVDTGIDFRNPDFITYDSQGRPTSRLLYFWDTFSTAFETSGNGSRAPYSYPNGRPIGTLYTGEQLTAELRSNAGTVPATDEYGHGTAATGIAAGNGNNSKGRYAGVAPEANIIGVRVGGSTGAIENAYLLNAAVAWVDSIAKREGKPVVFSCSFGGQMGSHDGNSVEERELDARFAPGVQGRAIVIAAGNDQGRGIHARGNFSGASQPAQFAWKSDQGSPVLFFFRMGNGATPDVRTMVAAPLMDSNSGQYWPAPQLQRVYPNPLSGDLVGEYLSSPGFGGVMFWNTMGQPIQVDGYVPGGSFYPSLQREAEIVGSPGTTASAITVGSYDWNDQFDVQNQIVTLKDVCGTEPMHLGDLSCYSSIGYSRTGRVKPDITAPGQWYTSSYAKLPSGQGVKPEVNHVDSSGNYMLFNGTSAATPYTAGIIALMMQKKNTITVGEIKSLLQHWATQDAFTGKGPNLRWGNGKLDLAAVRSILNAVQ